MKIDKDRLFQGKYYLDEWGVNYIEGAFQLCCDPCSLCDLCNECDRLSDELNDIHYCMCLSEGIIKDVKYKKVYPNAYFKKINFNI